MNMKKCARARCEVFFDGSLKDGSPWEKKRFCSRACKDLVRRMGRVFLNKENIKKRELRIEAIKTLGGECAVCHTTEIQVLQIDHIDSLAKRREKRTSPYVFLKKIIKGNVENIQLLCANCHMKKTFKARWGIT